MMHNIKMQDLFHCTLNVLYARITKFHYFMTFSANKVVVLFVTVRLLVLRKVLAELMLAYQITLYKQIKRVVYSRPAERPRHAGP